MTINVTSFSMALKRGKLTRAKARKILRDKTIRGKRLTAKQKRFFGARAGGAPIRRKRRKK